MRLLSLQKKTNILMFRSLVFLVVLLAFYSNKTNAQQKYQLVETGSEASCFYYKVADENGKWIKMPAEIDSALSCPSGLLGISPDSKYLIYVWSDLQLYDFTTKKKSVLLNMDEPSEGFSNICWSPNETKMMFVNIDQNTFVGGGRIHVIEIDNDKLCKHQYFDVPVNYTCGSSCFSESGIDFWFNNNVLISYKRNINLETDPGKIVEIDLK